MSLGMSLNRAILRLRTIAESHKQIGSFYYGDFADALDTDIDFPLCAANYTGGNIDGIGKVTNYNFSIYFIDLVNQSTNAMANEPDVISDMLQIAEDIIGEFKNQDWAGLMYIESPASVEPLMSVTPDKASGVKIDVTLQSAFDSSRCDGLILSQILPPEYMATITTTRLKLYTVPADAASITIAEIVGKPVIAVYRDGVFRQPKATSVTDTRQIQVVGTQSNSNDAVVASTGVINLTPNDIFYTDEKISIQYIA